MEIILVLVVGALNIACFFVGAKVGQTVAKGKDIESPSINPLDFVQKQREKKEAERKKTRIETIMRNIDNYDGTSAGQEEVPR